MMPRRPGTLLLAGGGLALLAGPAAADWRVTPEIAVQQSYTTNARDRPKGQEQGDFFTTVSPGVTLRGTTPSNTLTLNYGLDFIEYWNNSDLGRMSNRLQQTGTTQIIRDSVFLDTRASISQVATDNAGQVSSLGQTAPVNRTELRTYSASPAWRYHFGGFAQSELRYTFSQVFTSGQTLQDQTTNRVTGTLKSGRDFTQLRWTLTLDDTESDQSGGARADTTTSNKIAEANGEYDVNRYFTLLSSVGYQKLDDPSLRNNVDGPTWSAGFAARPGPRTNMRLTYGHRDGADSFSGDGTYKFSAKTSLTATYSERIQTTQTVFQNNLQNLTTDEFGNFIDSRTASAFNIGNTGFGLANNAFHQKRFEMRFVGSSGRNGYGALASREERETDATSVTQIVDAISVNWSRTLDPYASANATLRYQTTDFGTTPTRKDDLYGVQFGLNYRFGPSFYGFATNNLLLRKSDAANADLTENITSVGLRKIF
jgi:uncharacterized protein (PEP-CTERM system associated)